MEEQFETMNYGVNGVTFEGRQEILRPFYEKTYKAGGTYAARLVEEPDNQYDPNAVAVELETSPGSWSKVGYVPRDQNALAKSLMPRMVSAGVASMGYTRKGDVGLSVTVKYGKEA